MRVLVTGAGGFVGSTLVPRLVAAGYEVIATDTQAPARPQAARWVIGDIGEDVTRKRAVADCEAVIHLATVPGGAAEAAPSAAHRINVDATVALSRELASLRRGATFIFASSIAVLGHPLSAHVDDATPTSPMMIYGAHKAMMETWLATLNRRGDLTALSLRLPGVVARPEAPSGMKSAFLSNLFHALANGRHIELPVSADATMWLMSVAKVADCFVHALGAAVGADARSNRAITLPALRVRMGDLVTEISRQTDSDLRLAGYRPDPLLEEGFGRQPPLSTATADALGFGHDGDLASLVNSSLGTLNTNGKTTA